ncbi:tetratricopeptide repeat protein [Bacteroides sp.]
MKKIFNIILSLFIIVISVYGQDSLSVDSLQGIKDSVQIGSHTEFSAATLGEVSKSEGDSAYMKNDFASAIQIYEALLKKGEAAEIYYNLGNSYYKADDIAKAILNYERALLLQPGNNDIRANLDVVRSKTVDKMEAVPEIFFISWTRALIYSVSVNTWAVLGIVCFILLIISLYFFIFSKQIIWKKSGFVAGIAFLILVILSNVFAAQQKEDLLNRDKAIIMNPSVTVRSTPNESGTGLFVLHEGSKVSIKDASMRDWKEIRLEDGKVGWVPTSTIEII